MWEFRHLKLPRLTPASKGKSHVSSAVPKLSIPDRLVLVMVMLWCVTVMYWLYTAERDIDPELYRDNIDIDTDHIA